MDIFRISSVNILSGNFLYGRFHLIFNIYRSSFIITRTKIEYRGNHVLVFIDINLFTFKFNLL